MGLPIFPERWAYPSFRRDGITHLSGEMGLPISGEMGLPISGEMGLPISGEMGLPISGEMGLHTFFRNLG
jgi:hypothetical protein